MGSGRTVTPTARGQDALACLAAAVQHAEHLLQLEDLRSDHGEVDLVDETTGELLRTIRPHKAPNDRTPRDAYLAGRQVALEGRYPSWSRRRVR